MQLFSPTVCGRQFASRRSPLHQLPTRAATSNLHRPARTRFAPSPTGYLHLGSLRTALFNYLLAKNTKGDFILRLEDTDRKRTVPDAEQRLYDDLRWAGLQWDEGPDTGGPFAPYRQSDRTAIYQAHAKELLQTPHAYRCFCSVERLNHLASQRKQLGLPTDYDRTCASISIEESDERAHKGDPFVVRLKVPDKYPSFEDLVYGRQFEHDAGAQPSIIQKHGQTVYEDPVLLKSDGTPTYHFANVVDDRLMKITHVIRGTEWLSSTPKHVQIYKAFGWETPSFAHVGLLANEHGQKLSKRNNTIGIAAFRDKGILPVTLLNFAALLGWSHSRKKDVMDLGELIQEFQMKFTKGNCKVTTEKLDYLQKNHAGRAAKRPDSSTFQILKTAVSDVALRQLNAEPESFTVQNSEEVVQRVENVLKADAGNYQDPEQFWSRNETFFVNITSPGPFQNTTSVSKTLQELKTMTNPLWDVGLQDWNRERLLYVLRSLCLSDPSGITEHAGSSIKFQPGGIEAKLHGLHCHFLRWALLGVDKGPGIVDTLLVFGKDESKRRFHDTIRRFGHLRIGDES